MILAKRIRLIREAKGLTQAEVAYLATITPSAYGQIERKAADSKLKTLQKIADALSVSVTFLMDTPSSNLIEIK